MADLSITASSVVPSAGVERKFGTAGVAITAGQVVYIDTADDNLIKLADANGTGDALVVAGIAVCSAAIGQTVVWVEEDDALAIGATVAVGAVYICSATAGGIAPAADLNTGWYGTVVGIGVSTTAIKVGILASGVAA